MGKVVLHMQKAKGNDAGTTAHIERTVQPKNADPERTHLNKEFIDFPDGVETRTQAIQHRIEKAGIKRKIRHDQVRAIQVMLSGTPEDMRRIQAEGKLDDWCRDNVEWLRETFGRDNVVSAVLHMDEKTPHIHATVVPIVTGERRKSKKKPDKPEDGKKKYRKKDPNAARLCVDDVMTRDNLKLFQDTYAVAMNKYGLQRGIDGSEARHISTRQFYRELFVQNEDLKENIDYLEEQKQEVYEKVRDMYDRKDEAQEKFWNMHYHLQQQKEELTELEAKLQTAEQKYEPYKAQEDMNLMFDLFPKLADYLHTARLGKAVGLTVDAIKRLFSGETITTDGHLYSPEHKRTFEIKDAKIQVVQEDNQPGSPGKLLLSVNGKEITEWFKEQFAKVRQTIRPHIKPPKRDDINERKGLKM